MNLNNWIQLIKYSSQSHKPHFTYTFLMCNIDPFNSSVMSGTLMQLHTLVPCSTAPPCVESLFLHCKGELRFLYTHLRFWDVKMKMAGLMAKQYFYFWSKMWAKSYKWKTNSFLHRDLVLLSQEGRASLTEKPNTVSIIICALHT